MSSVLVKSGPKLLTSPPNGGRSRWRSRGWSSNWVAVAGRRHPEVLARVHVDGGHPRIGRLPERQPLRHLRLASGFPPSRRPGVAQRRRGLLRVGGMPAPYRGGVGARGSRRSGADRAALGRRARARWRASLQRLGLVRRLVERPSGRAGHSQSAGSCHRHGTRHPRRVVPLPRLLLQSLPPVGAHPQHSRQRRGTHGLSLRRRRRPASPTPG